MNPLARPMLPSPLLRAYYEALVTQRLEPVKAPLRNLVLDGLGDLAQALARQPIRLWSGTPEAFARALGERWTWPEATAIIELGVDNALLRRLPDGRLRPDDIGVFTWLGARRIALTEDQDGWMDFRLNGSFYDMFALAPSLVADPEAGANLVALMASRPGPFDEVFGLAHGLAASAVAWGAPAAPEVVAFLVERAITWNLPMGADWNREPGTALLVRACQESDDREHLLNLAADTLADVVTNALSDDELAGLPAVHATIDTQLAMLLTRGVGGERLAMFAKRLPPAHAFRLGRAVGRILPPGPARDRALIDAAELALRAGNPAALAALEGLTPAGVEAAQELVATALTTPDSALGACQVLLTWDHLPTSVADAARAQLTGLTGSRSEVRMAAAEALRHHGASVDVDALVARLPAESSDTLAGAVGALLQLGARDERLPGLTLAVAAAAPREDLVQRLGAALAAGIRAVPEHAEHFVTTLAALPHTGELVSAALGLGAALTDILQSDADLGPFASAPALMPAANEALARAFVNLASTSDDPFIAAEAATVTAAFLRGDAAFGRALAALRKDAPDPRLKSLYDLALGAARVSDPAVLDRLGRDAAQAESDVAAAACVALRLLVETFAAAQALAPWIDQLRGRLDQLGDHQVPLQQLLVQLATLPLG